MEILLTVIGLAVALMLMTQRWFWGMLFVASAVALALFAATAVGVDQIGLLAAMFCMFGSFILLCFAGLIMRSGM